MKKICILSDFDGTITEKDALYFFFKKFAKPEWLEVEKQWTEGKIDSKECLKQEFALIPNLTKGVIDKYLDTVTIDKYFKEFYEIIKEKNIDLFIVSDGVDYFIERVLKNNGIEELEILSNHGEFQNNQLELTFPNANSECLNGAGTCKCAIVRKMKNEYDKVVYIGDGMSDFCVAGKTDYLFAKNGLAEYCKKKGINHVEYADFKGVITNDMFRKNSL